MKWIDQEFHEARANFLKASKCFVSVDRRFSNFCKFFYEIVPIDVILETLLLSSKHLHLLKKGISRLSRKIRMLIEKWPKSFTYGRFPLVKGKFECIETLLDIIENRRYDSNSIDIARNIFREHGFLKGKRSVDAIENFAIHYIKLYDSKRGILSAQDEHSLLQELRPAVNLNGVLTRDFMLSRLREMYQKAEEHSQVVIKQGAEIEETFRKIGEQARLFGMQLRKEETYEVYINGKRETRSAANVNNVLRRRKDKYHLWIDMDKGEVLVNNKQENPGEYTLNLLIYLAKIVGKLRQKGEFFKAVWGKERKDSISSLTNGLQKMISQYVYKYGEGVLKKHIEIKRGEKGGYRVKETLHSCLISKKLEHPL